MNPLIHSLFFAVVLSVGISIGVYLVLWGFVIMAESEAGIGSVYDNDNDNNYDEVDATGDVTVGGVPNHEK